MVPKGGVMKHVQKLSWIVLMVAVFGCMYLASASVVVAPSSAQVKLDGQLQFTASGSADNVVIWSVSGAGCSGISCGEISGDGLYTAPATAPSPATVVVVATSLLI